MKIFVCMKFVKGEVKNLKGLFRRFRRRDFTGDVGQAIKNSSHQLTINIIMKVGSILFTIIVARLLMPELFGIYSLSLSIIILFSSFSDIGIVPTLTTFISKSLRDGDKEKAKKYTKKLLKWKVWLLFLVSLILIISSYFITVYIGKPIFYALLVGSLYLFIFGLLNFLDSIFKAYSIFRYSTLKEVFVQLLKLVIVPLTIILTINYVSDKGVMIAITLLASTLCYSFGIFYLILMLRR